MPDQALTHRSVSILIPLNLHLSLGSPFSCFGARWYPLCSPPPFLQCSRAASLFPHPSQFSTQEHSELRPKPSNNDLMASPVQQQPAPLKKTLQTQSLPQETPGPYFHTHTLEWPPPGAPFPEYTLFLLPLVNLRRTVYPDLTLPTHLAPGIHISEHCLGGRPHAECSSCFFIPGGRYYYSPFINDKTEPLRDEVTCPSSQS